MKVHLSTDLQLILILAFFTHTTAVVGLIAFLIVYLCFKYIKKIKIWHILLITLAGFFAIVFLPRLFNTMISIGLLEKRFAGFLSSFNVKNYSRFGFLETLFRAGIFSVILCKFKNNDKLQKIWYISSSIGCVSYSFAYLLLRIGTFYRVSEYFDYYFILSLPKIFSETRMCVNRKNAGNYILLLLLIVYWLVFYIIFAEGLGFGTDIYSFR